MPDRAFDPTLLRKLTNEEDARFAAARPRSRALLERARGAMPNGVPMAWFASAYAHSPLFVARGDGARFTDVDGNEYSDFNIADMSMFGGYAPEPVVRAVAKHMAAGNQFLLPTEDSVWIAEELGRRFGLPKWQFTLSASQANVEAIRVARVSTGRDKGAHVRGEGSRPLRSGAGRAAAGEAAPEEPGLPSDVTRHTRVVAFNDPDALREALEPRDVALVMAEPAMTNNHGLVLPEPEFHASMRSITRETGTLLCMDETHTQVCGPGGLTRIWSLEPKSAVLREVGRGRRAVRHRRNERRGGGRAGADERFAGTNHQPVATGGTLFGNALSMVAARATLSEVLTGEATRTPPTSAADWSTDWRPRSRARDWSSTSTGCTLDRERCSLRRRRAMLGRRRRARMRS